MQQATIYVNEEENDPSLLQALEGVCQVANDPKMALNNLIFQGAETQYLCTLLSSPKDIEALIPEMLDRASEKLRIIFFLLIDSKIFSSKNLDYFFEIVRFEDPRMLLRYHIVSTPDQIATIFQNILQNEIFGMIKPVFEELKKDCKFDRA